MVRMLHGNRLAQVQQEIFAVQQVILQALVGLRTVQQCRCESHSSLKASVCCQAHLFRGQGVRFCPEIRRHPCLDPQDKTLALSNELVRLIWHRPL